MIKIDNVEVIGWEHAIRGMRNPKNSWERSDSSVCAYSSEIEHCADCPHIDSCNADDGDIATKYIIGPNDKDLMTKLAKGGPVHAKYRRMITVYLDITAPLYWWKEFDTYKVGTVANSCSTMHKIHDKEFELGDFSCEHLCDGAMYGFQEVVRWLNCYREEFLKSKDKDYWWQMIQLLPSSYNQKRTIMLNYEVLVGMYNHRKHHKLDEWNEFCEWIETLPYSEIITGKNN